MVDGRSVFMLLINSLMGGVILWLYLTPWWGSGFMVIINTLMGGFYILSYQKLVLSKLNYYTFSPPLKRVSWLKMSRERNQFLHHKLWSFQKSTIVQGMYYKLLGIILNLYVRIMKFYDLWIMIECEYWLTKSNALKFLVFLI